jgi:hypothetical protein
MTSALSTLIQPLCQIHQREFATDITSKQAYLRAHRGEQIQVNMRYADGIIEAVSKVTEQNQSQT